MGIKVGQSFRQINRYHNDPEFRRKHKEHTDNWQKKNRDKVNELHRNYIRKLNEFADKHCKVCNVLLWYKNKSMVCRQCISKLGGPSKVFR